MSLSLSLSLSQSRPGPDILAETKLMGERIMSKWSDPVVSLTFNLCSMTLYVLHCVVTMFSTSNPQ